MFKNTDLENELKYSHTIDSAQAVFVEWNLNQSYNISKVGNYRYRPGTTDSNYGAIRYTYESTDPVNTETGFKGYYTGATDSDTVVEAGFDDSDKPAYLIAPKEKIAMLYSLDDCFRQNRPRSGINKLLYLGITGGSSGYSQYIDSLVTYKETPDHVGYLATSNIARRPRYYMASRYDDFKYWTSYRTEVVDNVTQEYGVALNVGTGGINQSYYIYDSAPFVVYNDKVPANRIAVKMQTNVGDINNGPYRVGSNASVADPLYGEANKTVPKRWAIQTLNENNEWVQAISFDESSMRSDSTPIIGTDGQVEIEYGLVIPELYQSVFTYAGEILSLSMLPEAAPYGYAYLYKTSDTDRGMLYVNDGSSWQSFVPEYSWKLSELDITKNTSMIKKLSNPDYFIDNSTTTFREFQFVYGMRIVLDTMNKVNSTFDLIEFSPRLVADITDKTVSFSVNKTLADLGTHSMPTGNLLASTGSISIFDEDLAFNENNVFDDLTNTGSIISQYSNSRLKFLFYDIVKNVNSYDYYIPIKSLYSERIPQVTDTAALINIDLRDLFYYLESKKAPELLLTNVSLSYAITVLLDNIGFSNYVFKRTEQDEELIIPFFFVGTDQNIAEALQGLAVSSQSAIFFDEYNNLVVMSKNYLLPSVDGRPTDLVFYGQEEVEESLVALPNIINVASVEKPVFNGGEINYTTRYIQKTIGSIAQAPYIDDYKTFIYKPVLLWEVAGKELAKTINESASQPSGYALSAMPLKTTLVAEQPTYDGINIFNNILDFGESIYWLGNYSGYFYANGEVIRYDAVEYSVAGVGNVWIKNNQEYQQYFAKLRFNGKMYPTGRVRIYTNIQNDVVKEHGRGQFGTTVVEHTAGIEAGSSWESDSNVRASIQNAKEYLFNTNVNLSYPNNTGIEEAGNSSIVNGNVYTSQSYAIKSTRNGIIKNFMANTNITEDEANYYKSVRSGSVQTSALVFNGPSLPAEIDPANFVTYVYKPMVDAQNNLVPYKHFGTRMRIIGRIESGTNQEQRPLNAFDIYSPSDLLSSDPEKQISITGGSGGLSFGLNKDTNVGYYFEIAALSQTNISSYNNNSNTANYTILRNPVVQSIDGVVTVTLETQHDFEVGVQVTISGLVDDNDKTASSTPLNGEYLVTEISSDRKMFRYNIGTSLTTTASTGGTVIRDLDKDTLISDIFFYKVVSGSTTADIIKKSRTVTTVTLTTLREHSLIVGEPIIVADVDPALDGTYQITSVGPKTISYETSTSGTIAEADLDPLGLVTGVNKVAIPEILWRGYSDINVDDGKFSTQSRLTTAEKTTVYDLAVEYIDIGTTRQFYLYINNKQIAIVNDTNPLPAYNNMALFIRGGSRVMFENVYALADNFAENNARSLQLPVSKVFGDDVITESEALKKYAISGIVQNTYLSGISSEAPPQYSIFYDEFGTIMREAAYFNIKYDRAYPALYAQLAPTINRVRGYAVSGFLAGSYGAEFLIFNVIDKNLNLDDTSGNHLRIFGIAFTQNTTHNLKVDDFFKKNSNFTDAFYNGTGNSGEYQQLYTDVLNSRNKYGRNDFVIDTQHVQTDAAADSMMDWVIRKTMAPRQTVGLTTMATQHLQLGDIVEINYKSNGVDVVSPDTTRFVVYNIEYSKDSGSASTTVHLAEV